MPISTTTAYALAGSTSGSGGGADENSMLFGFYNNFPGLDTNSDTAANWDAMNSTMSGYVRRSFSTGLPTNISTTSAAGDAARGITTFHSVKADPAQVAAGTHDAAIASFAASMPAKSFLTMHHEPENDMNGATFVAMFQRFYTVAKTANPSISVGPVHMTYHWRVGAAATTNPDDWWLGNDYCDFIGTDSYYAWWRGTSSPKGLGQDAEHMRWHNWAAGKGKPLAVVENSVSNVDANGNPYYTETQRAQYIRDCEVFLREQNYMMWLWWNGNLGGGENWTINEQPQALAAWNEAAGRSTITEWP